jgi:hypothetical protein
LGTASPETTKRAVSIGALPEDAFVGALQNDEHPPLVRQ